LEAKRIKFYEFGEPQDVLKVEKHEVLLPRNGEILVRMKLRPINPSDLIPIRGAYAHRIPLPAVPGYEGVGIVEEVGPFVSKELLGKRVLPLRGEGTWQEFVKTTASLAVPIPNAIDDVAAAQLYINPITAWIICTEILKLKPDDVLLMNACGSSIGRIFAQLAKVLGFRLIAVVRNAIHTEELRKLGAFDVINTSNTPLHSTVMQLTNGRGVSAAIDSVGGLSGTELAYCVRPSGAVLTIGLLSGIPVNWSEVVKETKVNVKLFHLRHWNQEVSAHRWQETFLQIFDLINSQRLKLMESAALYALSNIKEAVQAAEQAGKKGKVYLRP
jgi:NADPH:quinone reductase-like Zn-dependent oxidoreductase